MTMTPKLQEALITVADALAELPVDEMEIFYACGLWVDDNLKERHPAKYQEWIAWQEKQKKLDRSAAARRAAQTRARARQQG